MRDNLAYKEVSDSANILHDRKIILRVVAFTRCNDSSNNQNKFSLFYLVRQRENLFHIILRIFENIRIRRKH